MATTILFSQAKGLQIRSSSSPLQSREADHKLLTNEDATIHYVFGKHTDNLKNFGHEFSVWSVYNINTGVYSMINYKTIITESITQCISFVEHYIFQNIILNFAEIFLIFLDKPFKFVHIQTYHGRGELSSEKLLSSKSTYT